MNSKKFHDILEKAIEYIDNQATHGYDIDTLCKLSTLIIARDILERQEKEKKV